VEVTIFNPKPTFSSNFKIKYNFDIF